MINWIKNRIECWRKGHDFERISTSLIGDWIKCKRCGHLDEHVPGMHHPKGYHETNR